MKRIRCPKCDEAILFDETKYEAGRVLVFECPQCNKQFKIRIPRPQKQSAASDEEEASQQSFGQLIVLENAFQFKQVLTLSEGDNVIGRLIKGTNINTPIKTVDPSIDATHCVLTVQRNKQNKIQYTLRDAPSNTGTFLHNKILGNRERVLLNDGDIITIGASTIIFRTTTDEEEETD